MDNDRVADEAVNDGTSRRDFIKKAAVGAAYVVPAMQVVNMASARAGTAPSGPTTTVPNYGNTYPSYVALNVTCGDNKYVIKWEDDEDPWDDSPGEFPSCDDFVPYETKADGAALGFVATPNPENGFVAITVPDGCTVDAAAVKKAQNCCYVPVPEPIAGPTTLYYYCSQ